MGKFKDAGLYTLFGIIIGGLIGGSFSYVINERTIQAKYIELAVSILRDKPSEEKKDLRRWAVKNINEYAEIKLSNKLMDDLTEKISLDDFPQGYWPEGYWPKGHWPQAPSPEEQSGDK